MCIRDSRWADKQKKVKPLFPCGHGLSYTTFEYGKPTADSKTMQADGTLTVKVSVKNTGAVSYTHLMCIRDSC